MNVRELLPTRRLVPSNKPTGENWSDHKDDLQTDFYFHCGYCGSYDGFRHTYYEVDHFVPKSLFEKNNIITYCQYDNLVYSCKFCNNKKHAKWPSNDETIHNVNNEGFVDPCNADYDNHLKRTEKGSIRWKTDLGKWMVEKGFKFDERDFGIRLLWELNQLRKTIDLLVNEMAIYDSNSEEYKSIYDFALQKSFSYTKVHSKLINYYNNI